MPRALALDVADDFADAWLEHGASVAERTAALRFACALPREASGVAHAQLQAAVRDALEAHAAPPTPALAVLERELDESRRRAEADAARAEEARRALSEACARAERAEAQSARGDELARMQAADEVRGKSDAQLDELRAQLRALSEDKVRVEQELTQQLRAQMQESLRASQEGASLRAEIEALRTPAGRGRAAEESVGEALSEAGFDVRDTSMGAAKDEGYMDLLATVGDVRVAVEIKNRASIDPNTDLRDFAAKAKAGVAKKLYDSAVFISVRAHTKKSTAYAVEMLEDARGDESVPVSYLGPERGGGPLAREAVQSHVCTHAAFVLRWRALRGLLDQRSVDADAERVRELVDHVAAETQTSMEELAQQAKLVTAMQASLKAQRARALQVAASVCEARAVVPWLGTSHAEEPPWMAAFRLARDKVASGEADASVWKNLSDAQKKRVADHGGREAFFRAVRTAKRTRDEDEEEGGE